MSDINSEIESLKKDPKRELNKMKSSSNANDDRTPPNDAPNMSGPPSDAPNINKESGEEKEHGEKKEGTTKDIDAGKDNKEKEKEKGNGNVKTTAQDKNNEEIYKVLDIVLSTIVSKLKLLFMMPYVFFTHYVKDFIIENKSKEQIKREIKHAVITSFCVLGLQLVMSFLTKDFNMVKVLPVFGALVFCLMDADNKNGK